MTAEPAQADHRVVEVRERLGLTQDALASRMGTSRGQVANLEAGERRMTLDWLRRFATALNCSVADLLLPTDVPNLPDPTEAELLRELRSEPNYDPGLFLQAARALLRATRHLLGFEATRMRLAGDDYISVQMADLWSDLDAIERERALAMLRMAHGFSAPRGAAQIAAE